MVKRPPQSKQMLDRLQAALTSMRCVPSGLPLCGTDSVSIMSYLIEQATCSMLVCQGQYFMHTSLLHACMLACVEHHKHHCRYFTNISPMHACLLGVNSITAKAARAQAQCMHAGYTGSNAVWAVQRNVQNQAPAGCHAASCSFICQLLAGALQIKTITVSYTIVHLQRAQVCLVFYMSVTVIQHACPCRGSVKRILCIWWRATLRMGSLYPGTASSAVLSAPCKFPRVGALFPVVYCCVLLWISCHFDAEMRK